MPAVSEAQRRLFGIALAIKRRQAKKHYSGKAAEIAKQLSERQIKDFASKRE